MPLRIVFAHTQYRLHYMWCTVFPSRGLTCPQVRLRNKLSCLLNYHFIKVISLDKAKTDIKWQLCIGYQGSYLQALITLEQKVFGSITPNEHIIKQ